MKHAISVLRCAALLLLGAALISCGGSGGGDSGGSPSPTGIADSYSAKDMVKNIYRIADTKVMSPASNGASINVTIQGTSGTAVVTGKNTYVSGVSCGTNCVSSTRDVDVTIVFTNFVANSMTNVTMTMNGTIKYKDNHYSSQSGVGSYYSSSSISILSPTTVQASMVIYNSTTGAVSSSVQDTITFTASGTDEYSLSGTCKGGNGTTYSF